MPMPMLVPIVFFYPRWQPPLSARCLVGWFLTKVFWWRFAGQGVCQGVCKELATTPKTYQIDPQILPKCSQNAPKSTQNGLKWPQSGSLVGNLQKGVPKWLLLPPKVPQEGPKRRPKITKNFKKHSPKIGSKKHRKQQPNNAPKAAKRRPKSHFLGDFGSKTDHWTPKAFIRSNLSIP